MTGGEALVRTLVTYGVTQAFGVPGESYLAVLEGLRQARDRLRFTVTRHEAGAAFAAEAYAKLARRPAAVLVTRGPGACNAAIGVHTAAQDSTPLLLCIGHVATALKGWEAFQEIDYHRMYAPLVKAVLEPATAADVAACTARALRLAVAGRPGPVAVVLPEDVTEADAGAPAIPPPVARPATGPDPEAVAHAVDRLREARHPVVLAGELLAYEHATSALVLFAETTGAGVITVFRRQDAFPNDHPAYLGHFGIGRSAAQRELWAACDLVVAAGTRLDDITTEEFTLLRPDQGLVLIHPDPAVHARWPADVHLMADVRAALNAMTGSWRGGPPPDREAWRARYHAAYLADSTPGAVPTVGDVDLARVVAEAAALLPPDAVITNDAGNFAGWVHRYYRFREPATQAAPGSGAMGYGVPAALGAQLARPGRPVVAFVGDGGFLMTGQELVTAVQEGLPVRVIVCDNRGYGTILMHQYRRLGPDAAFAVTLESPDFAQVARGYGAAAFTVEKTAEFRDAFRAALAHPGPALVHVRTDLRDISAAGPLPA